MVELHSFHWCCRAEVLAMVPDKEGPFAKVPKIATGADTPTTASTDEATSSSSVSSSMSSTDGSSSSEAAAGASGEISAAELAQLAALDLRVGVILSCEQHPEADK
jgi:hypothetical protein